MKTTVRCRNFSYIAAGKTWRQAYYTVFIYVISTTPICGIATWKSENISRGNGGEECAGGGYCLLLHRQFNW
jgi:hypothetical protein